ncbi:MAG: NnrS family protein, partial [Thiobacillus sp.]|nr:NnrS family protein [Thiobacillus sp.]
MTGFPAHIAAAPHRALFLPGAIQTVATMVWWLAILAGRLGGRYFPPDPALAAGAGHAWLMLYGLLPFFVFGFLFTAMPNWLETGPIARRHYLATALAMSAGAALFYPGLYRPGLAVVAVLLHLAGWGIGLTALFGALRASRQADRGHAG